MKKTFTPLQLMLHVYGEAGSGDREALMFSLYHDEALNTEFKKLQALKKLLDNSCTVPSIATIQKIKAYARALEIVVGKDNNQFVYLLN